MRAALGWRVARRLFSVFGQCGLAHWFAWGLAPVPLPVVGLVVGTGRGAGLAGGGQELFEAAGVLQNQFQKVLFGR
jgi:hypothetical protein